VFNLVERDDLGTYREHLWADDVYGKTGCGLNVADLIQPPSMPNARKIIACHECARLQPAEMKTHKFMREGGSFNSAAGLARILRDIGVPADDERLTRLTPALYREIRAAISAGTFANSGHMCPCCGRGLSRESNRVYRCRDCALSIRSGDLEFIRAYPTHERTRAFVLELRAACGERRSLGVAQSILRAAPSTIALEEALERMARPAVRPMYSLSMDETMPNWGTGGGDGSGG
jgi:ribosomal protein L37AE/L43A